MVHYQSQENEFCSQSSMYLQTWLPAFFILLPFTNGAFGQILYGPTPTVYVDIDCSLSSSLGTMKRCILCSPYKRDMVFAVLFPQCCQYYAWTSKQISSLHNITGLSRKLTLKLEAGSSLEKFLTTSAGFSDASFVIFHPS